MTDHDDIQILNVDDSTFATLLVAVGQGKPVEWVEDELFPYTEEDRRRDIGWCWLYDRYGREVANLWLEKGCPVPFRWTEIIPS